MRKVLFAIMIVLLVVPAVVLAQEAEMTMEDLAGRIADLTERLERVELLFHGPGAIEVDGGCVIGMPDHLQDETVLKYKEKFDEWLDTNSIWPVEIRNDTKTGNTTIVYTDDIGMFADYQVEESWSGCEFLGSTDWYEIDQ